MQNNPSQQTRENESYNYLSSQWLIALNQIIKDMDYLIHGTEADFLAVGDHLQQCFSSSHDISNMTLSITDLFSGTGFTQSLNSLSSLSKEIDDFVGSCDTATMTSIDTLKELDSSIKNILSPLEDFNKTIRFLKMLGISTKIECSRIDSGNSNFNALADEVGHLASSIETQIGSTRDALISLKSTISDNVTIMEKLRTDHCASVMLALDETNKSIKTLNERHNNSLQTVDQVSALSQKTSNDMSTVVSLMQFHDITRQKIEHIKDALSSITEKLNENSTVDFEQNILLVKKTVELQAAQTSVARQEMNDSVSNIHSNLADIADNILDMNSTAQNLTDTSTEKNKSVFSDIKQNVGQVSLSINQVININKDIAVTLQPLSAMIDNLDAFMTDVQKISSQIRLIALNALIQAEQTGDKGATLSVLADSIRQLAVETEEKTLAFGDSSKIVVNAGDVLHEILNEGALSKSKTFDQINHNFTEIFGILENVNTDVITKIEELIYSSSKLAQDVEAEIKAFQIHQVFNQMLEKSQNSMNQIVTDINENFSNIDAKAARLENLSSQYTMESERVIHNKVMDESNIDVFSEPVNSTEFDSNIELF